MAQTQTQKYASNIQSAEQKFAQVANSLKMKISKTIAVFKKKATKWTSGSSSHSSSLAGTITIQEAKERNLAKNGCINANSRLLLSI